jgi:glycosyl transferase family 2
MAFLREIVSYHGTILAVQAKTGTVVNCAEAAIGSSCARIVAIVPEKESGVCFLVPKFPVEPVLNLAGDAYPEQIIPLRSIASGTPGNLSFYHPRVGTYVVAGPPAADGVGGVAIDGQEIGDFERFTFHYIPSIFVPDTIAYKAERFEEILDAGISVDGLLSFLRMAWAGPDCGPLLDAVARLLPLEHLECLADRLPATPWVVKMLAELYENDVDATIALPRLLAWLASRATAPAEQPAPSRPRKRLGRGRVPTKAAAKPTDSSVSGRTEIVGAELDFLAERERYRAPSYSLPRLCNIAVRQSARPQRDVCIIATARNEGLYLLEWIAHHRAIGVDTIFLYTNDNSDGSDELLEALARSGIIVWLKNEVQPGVAAQAKAYGHALSVLPDPLDYRWALIIDLDEFFVFEPTLFRSLREYIAWQETRPVDAMAFNWLVLHSGGEVHWRDALVTRRFTQHAAVGPLIKSMSRPRKITHSTPHVPIVFPYSNFVFRDSDREAHSFATTGNPAMSDVPRSAHAWINHYFFKSAEEFVWKWSRNRGDAPLIGGHTNTELTKEFVEGFLLQHSRTWDTTDTIQRCVPDLDAHTQQLLNFPNVARAFAAIKQSYKETIGDLIEMLASAPGIVSAGEAGLRFLQLLRHR